MSTLSEIAYSIINTVRPKKISNDPVTSELVKYHVNNVRAQLIKQQIGKYSNVDKSYVQTIGCLDVELADKSECCEYPTGCKILKTSLNIPQTVTDNLLTRVGPVDITLPGFTYIEYERVPFVGYNKYTRDIKKWFKIKNNGTIYIVVPDNDLQELGLEVISIGGIFENPEDLSSFLNCSTGEVCFSDNSKYPVPASMIPIIQDIVIKNLLSIETKAQIDTTNDYKVNPSSQIVNK